jgi:hypothetical protein
LPARKGPLPEIITSADEQETTYAYEIKISIHGAVLVWLWA